MHTHFGEDKPVANIHTYIQTNIHTRTCMHAYAHVGSKIRGNVLRDAATKTRSQNKQPTQNQTCHAPAILAPDSFQTSLHNSLSSDFMPAHSPISSSSSCCTCMQYCVSILQTHRSRFQKPLVSGYAQAHGVLDA
jgi:hypothetical protein